MLKICLFTFVEPQEQQPLEIPMIQAMAVGTHERNINIFFVKQTVDDKGMVIEEKESLSFLSYMVLVWN